MITLSFEGETGEELNLVILEDNYKATIHTLPHLK